MKKTDTIYLEDIKKAIKKIHQHLNDTSKERFLENEMQQDAVMRQLAIVGEAADHLSKEFCGNHPTFPVREAADMRNFLIHAYDEVNLEIVWKTIELDLPLIEKQLALLTN